MATNRWEFEVSTILAQARANQIFPLFQDFFNIVKWYPGLTTSYGIYGTNGKVGCIRYVATSTGNWSTERLTAINPVNTTISYEALENNMGMTNYTTTFKVVPRDGGGCIIEWYVETDPVEGTAYDDFVKNYETSLQIMGERMKNAVINNQMLFMI